MPRMAMVVIILVFALGAGVGLVIASYMQFKKRKYPRAARRMNRWVVAIQSPLFAILVVQALVRRQYFIALLLGFAIVVNVWAMLRRPNRKEEIGNWTADPGKCGRCEYALMGNVSGICPECGWIIPAEEARARA